MVYQDKNKKRNNIVSLLANQEQIGTCLPKAPLRSFTCKCILLPYAISVSFCHFSITDTIGASNMCKSPIAILVKSIRSSTASKLEYFTINECSTTPCSTVESRALSCPIEYSRQAISFTNFPTKQSASSESTLPDGTPQNTLS